jgi:putative ABC transport system permease protein
MLSTFWQDVRYGLRRLLSSPAFTLIAIVSLALGIGANTAIFSLVNTILLRPFPVEEPERLVALHVTGPRESLLAFSYPTYVDFRDRNQVLSGLFASRMAPMSLSNQGNNQRIWGYLVSGNYFEVLGLKPVLGRMFTQEDDRTRLGSPVAVITHSSWQKRFGGDPNIVGREIILNDHQFKVIGIAPEKFLGTDVIYLPEIWLPMTMLEWIEPGANWIDRRGNQNIFATGRLKPGISMKQAEASLDLLAQQLGREYPDTNEGQRIKLTPPGMVLPTLRGGMISFAWVMLATVGMVLLIACTNLASLLLARGAERRKEIAVRLAIGAGRVRLIRQLLTESVILSAAGGFLGVLLAQWLIELVIALKPPMDIPLTIDLVIDYRVLVFAIAVSVATGLLFGIIPALQATKAELAPSLKNESTIGGYRRSRLRDVLIVAQLAFSLLLLIAAGLVVRALQQVRGVNPGFNPQNALMMSMDLSLQGYSDARGIEFQRQMLERVRQLPGVKAAAVTSLVPLSLNYSSNDVYIEGEALLRGANSLNSMNSSVSDGYFEAMDIPMAAGRPFNHIDKADSERTVIVNETFTRRYLRVDSPEKAIGRRFSLQADGDRQWLKIVGVAKDGKYFTVNESPQPFHYLPLEQDYEGWMTLIVRSNSNPEAILGGVRNEISKIDPKLPVYDVKTLNDHLSLSLFPARVAAGLLGSFGLLALLLAAIGIYGVTSYAVAQRTREIGIRMALGAERRDVVTMIVRHGLILTASGLVVGLGAAIALTRLMSAILYGVSATDVLTFTGVSVLLAMVAVFSGLIPALRASKVDPVRALRYE